MGRIGPMCQKTDAEIDQLMKLLRNLDGGRKVETKDLSRGKKEKRRGAKHAGKLPRG